MKLGKGIRIFVIILLILILCAGCVPDQYEPEEGVWFCKELQMQLSYEKGIQSFLVENGEKIICSCGSDRGVQYLFVTNYDMSHPCYSFDEELFTARIISLSETEFLVYDEQAERYYTFLRIDPVS